MQRIKLTIEYDGTRYAGWQRQDDAPSIQAAIERAIHDFCQEEVTLHCAGRTDAGVHARAQVAHFDMQAERSEFQIQQGLNHHLENEDIAILSVEKVGDDFHARFAATGRKYIYHIIHRAGPLALDKDRAWHIYRPLEIDAMQNATQHLIGHHDFSTFRSVACQAKSPLKTLDRLEITHDGENIRIHAEAQSFLHHQVRNMVGSLVQVGLGKWSAGDLIAARDAKDRTKGGPTAPARGLYLMEVMYESSHPVE